MQMIEKYKNSIKKIERRKNCVKIAWLILPVKRSG
jgi:hypothetical protein